MMVRKTRNPLRNSAWKRRQRWTRIPQGVRGGEEFGSHLPLASVGFITLLQESPGMMDSVLCWENSPAPLVTGHGRSLRSARSAWGLDAFADKGPGFISNRILD